MQFVGKVISSVSDFYRDINPSTLSGAIDVVVVENVETGELACSPFHVRFGKLQLLRPQEKVVELRINGVEVGEELRMKVGEAGETFFVLPKEELGWGGSDLPMEYLTSPLVGPETPVPIESIDEFKLERKAAETETETETSVPIVNPPEQPTELSPEWKWKWGDLPMKKETEIVGNLDVLLNEEITSEAVVNETIAVTNLLPENSFVPKVELYEYLAQKDYLVKLYESLARFPARSMITRIYRVDRGLHFNPPATWQEQLTSPAFVNESARLLESDFLLNPNVVIEESSRLLYQFTWENRKVVLGGSVGAAVVFYAQTFARILPLEIILKLAEIATIRMAKRKFGKSCENEEIGVAEETEKVEEIVLKSSEVIENPTGAENAQNLQSSQNLQSVTVSQGPISNTSINIAGNNRSSWRSWWSRSNANATAMDSDNSLNSDTSSTKSVPLLVVTSPGATSSPSKLTSKIDPPASLSTLINFESGVNPIHTSSSNSSIGVPIEVPTKRIVQRTASTGNVTLSSATIEITTTAGTLNNVSSMMPGPSSSPTAPGRRFAGNNPDQQFIKSLRLPSHLLKRLNLKPGVNTISYTVNTRLQGTATCQSRVFLWRNDSRVVISDIDGTITKSDALGHLFTMVGKDWTHVGVAQLYSKIAGNGYEFLYLTSRAIGQAASTRGYLKAVEQDRLQLPDGPVIMSPDRLFTALHREVIQRRPDEFKIACLRDIQKLFVNDDEEVSMMGSGMVSSSEDEYSGPTRPKHETGSSLNTLITPRQNTPVGQSPAMSASSVASTVTIQQNPFYAGFGNRPTDTKSYKAVGISASRIFLINPAGDLKLDKLTFYTPYSASSYSKLTEEVDKVFPPVRSPCSLARVAGDEAFTDFQYWHGHGGDVRMDLVQLALGSLSNPKRKVDALLDEYGKPVSQIGRAHV